MKASIVLIFMVSAGVAIAQSKSFQVIANRFAGEEHVTTITVGGVLLKTALWLSGEQKEVRREVGVMKSIRLINIPKSQLQKQDLKLAGFKKVLINDRFEEVIRSRSYGKEITVYLKERVGRTNFYMVLIENDRDITAIEIKGMIDPKKLVAQHSHHKFIQL